VSGEESISVSGISAHTAKIANVPDSTLMKTDDGRYWSRCEEHVHLAACGALSPPLNELHVAAQ